MKPSIDLVSKDGMAARSRAPPQNKSLSIPLIVWMTWRRIHDIPHKVIVDLQHFAPEYTLHLLDDEQASNFVSRHCGPTAHIRYMELQTPAHRADLWRYCALYHFGGVYLDVKTWLIKPLHEIFRPDAVDTAYTVRCAPPLDSCIYQGIMAAPPQDSTIRALIDLLVHASLKRLNSPAGYLDVVNQAYAALAGALGRVPEPQLHAAATASGRRWVIFRELSRTPCHRPDKYGKCYHIRDERSGDIVFRTRHPDFPAAFLGPSSFIRSSPLFACDFNVKDNAACVPGRPCPIRNTTSGECERLCLEHPRCMALLYNAYRQCYLKMPNGVRHADLEAHGTSRCVRKLNPSSLDHALDVENT